MCFLLTRSSTRTFTDSHKTPLYLTNLSSPSLSLTGHGLNPATVFTALQYFNIIRLPLIFIPMVMGNISEALVAVRRIEPFLMAEELADPYTYDPNAKFALKVDGDFVWDLDSSEKDDEKNKKETKAEKKEKKKKAILPVDAPKLAEEEKLRDPFALKGLQMTVDR